MEYTINIYQVLLNAKKMYLKGIFTGLCCTIRYSVDDFITNKYYKDNLLVKGFDIERIIPEYYPTNPYFKNVDLNKVDMFGFWWKESDKESRIKALDYLISCYEDRKDYEVNVNHIIIL